MQAAQKITSWPDADKEVLGHCPICRSTNSTVLHSGVRDGLFGAPGEWTFRLCSDCEVAYLDPRPTRASIGKAYEVYYTHDVAIEGGINYALTLLQSKIVTGRDNIYIRFIWPDGAILGRLLRPLFDKLAPRPIAAIGCKLRHLKPAARKGARLLDVGCGSGAFLALAEKLGYAAIGIDPDPVAVAAGVADGLDLRLASLENNDLPPGSFDHVMLSHVLEHLHDPVAALAEVRRLLCPGGRIWIVQPNLAALGLAEFGPSWRGLEAPRHLVLMKPGRLMELLDALGFVDAELKKPPYEAAFYFRQSLVIRDGENARWPRSWREAAFRADRAAFAEPFVSESMTIVAFKPLAETAATENPRVIGGLPADGAVPLDIRA